jgi:hypothetical protein
VSHCRGTARCWCWIPTPSCPSRAVTAAWSPCRAEKPCATASCTPSPAWCTADGAAAGNSRQLALGRSDHPGLATDLRTAGHQLTSTDPSLRPVKQTLGPVETPGTGPPAGQQSYPDAKISAVATILSTLRGSQRPA